jgi:hypothetical protein
MDGCGCRGSYSLCLARHPKATYRPSPQFLVATGQWLLHWLRRGNYLTSITIGTACLQTRRRKITRTSERVPGEVRQPTRTDKSKPLPVPQRKDLQKKDFHKKDFTSLVYHRRYCRLPNAHDSRGFILFLPQTEAPTGGWGGLSISPP